MAFAGLGRHPSHYHLWIMITVTITTNIILQLEDLEEDHKKVEDKKWAMIAIWRDRRDDDDNAPPLMELYDALRKNGRADVSVTLYKEAEKHYHS